MTNDPIDDFYKLSSNEQKAVAGEWEHYGVSLTDDDQCPFHGENSAANCWPCHVAGVQADSGSCEPIEAEE